MKVNRFLSCFLAAMLLVSLLTGAADAAETVSAEADERSAKEIVLDMIAENQQSYAPVVKTLENGVQVQRTPQDEGIYNVTVLDADNRGCYACHSDLYETVCGLNMSSWMWGLVGTHHFVKYDGQVEMTVKNCLECHEGSSDVKTYLHGIHSRSNAFTQMGGDCMSCHFVTGDGEMALWDNQKHTVLRGIVAADASTGEFSYDHETLSEEPLFNLSWASPSEYSEEMAFERYLDDLIGVKRDPAEFFGTFEDWEITVEGEVENPITFTLGELIDMGLSKTTVMAFECAENSTTGALIRNAEVTGIPVAALVEMAAPKETANFVYSLDQAQQYRYQCPMTMEWLASHEALLVYEVNGERLSLAEGYPVQIWVPGYDAGYYIKHVSRIVVASEYTYEEIRYGSGAPTQAIFYTQEGQLIAANEPYTFEGFAFARNLPISAMEFSLDQGATWTRFDTNDGVVGPWTYWRYTFTPEQEGAYVLCVRAIAGEGTAADDYAEVLVNAQ